MSSSSKIEWTDASWNPVVGCSILSPGCTNCYAMGEAARQIRCAAGLNRETHYAGTVKTVKGKPVWTGKLALAPESILLQPLKRKKPTMYFVNSMSDLFHEDVPDEWIDRVFAVMALCPQHTFQCLTKRAKRMREYLSNIELNNRIGSLMAKISDAADRSGIRHDHPGWGFERPPRHPMPPLDNIWLGVSTERQQEADERIPELLQTPAAVRFISAEPLLGPIDLTQIAFAKTCDCRDHAPTLNALDATVLCEGCCEGPERLDIGKLNWIITGGESGPDARPSHPAWYRALRDQCGAAGVAFFFKQWGAWKPWPKHPALHDDALCSGAISHKWPDECYSIRTSKKTAGRLLDGIEHNAMPGRSS